MQPNEIIKKHIAPCGLHCGGCSIFVVFNVNIRTVKQRYGEGVTTVCQQGRDYFVLITKIYSRTHRLSS